MLTYLDTFIGFAVVMLGVSLIVTILNQIVSTLLAHRGANLLWGLTVLFEEAGDSPAALPMLKAHAETLARTTLTHPLISDSLFSTAPVLLVKLLPKKLVDRWQLANAIAPDELVGVLTHIASNRPEGVAENLHRMLSAEITALVNTPAPQLTRQLALASVAGGVLPQTLVKDAVDVTKTPAGKVEASFASIKDRVSQRFTMWIRIWTVVFAFGIAFVGCIDAFQLFSDIYKSSDLRAKLVAAAPQIEDMAKTVIPPGATNETEAVEKSVTQTTSDALNQAVTDLKIAGVPKAVDITSDDQVSDWIGKNIPEAQRAGFQKAFQTDLTKASLQKLQTAAKIRDALSGTGLPLPAWSNWRWEKFPSPDFLSRLLGVFVSGLLLSLGAPFWFNSLSSLTNLRPVLSSQNKSTEQAKQN